MVFNKDFEYSYTSFALYYLSDFENKIFNPSKPVSLLKNKDNICTCILVLVFLNMKY